MIDLRVTCAACGHAVTHSVGAVLLDLDALAGDDDEEAWTRAVYVAMSLTCPSCGAVDEHRVDPESARSLSADDEHVREGRAALSDGTPIYTPSEGIRLLEARAGAAPNEPTTWRALGNFLLRAGRGDEALNAYRRGAELDGELHCALAVAVDAVARAATGAPDMVLRAVLRLPDGQAHFRALQSAQLAELLRRLGDRAPMLTVDGERVDPSTVRDWQRFGEQLASAKAIVRGTT